MFTGFTDHHFLSMAMPTRLPPLNCLASPRRFCPVFELPFPKLPKLPKRATGLIILTLNYCGEGTFETFTRLPQPQWKSEIEISTCDDDLQAVR